MLSLRDQIIKQVTKAIKDNVGDNELDDYLIVWKQLQGIASPIIKRILEKNFNGAKITIAQSKSTYPDIKMEWGDFKIAIDVKSNESSKEPWYDIARLETIVSSRINKYDEEYDVVIKYDSKTKKLLKIYFETLRDTVGLNKKCGGVKYRPYDGKVRPKNWDEFENGTTYWKTKEAFLIGIAKSIKYRQHELTKEYIKKLSPEEKKEFRDLFN